jgi:transposase
MAFREVSVVRIREVLRLWLQGLGYRPIACIAQVDRKTVRRYVEAAQAAGLRRGDSEDELTDDLIAEVLDAVIPGRPRGDHGAAWQLLVANKGFIEKRLGKDNDDNRTKNNKLTLLKVHDQFVRHTGHPVAYRTFVRFCHDELGYAKDTTTVRVADCEPGQEVQVDFGRMGLLFDLLTGRRRVCHALIFTAVFSRHMFVWLTFQQRFEDLIAGFESAWAFYQGVFRVVIPDNVKTIVDQAHLTDPRFNDAFIEYAQARGFVIDPARVGHAKDKPRVERVVRYVRDSFFKGEDFLGRDDAQRRAESWCISGAGMRIHGTTHKRPVEMFRELEQAALLPAPDKPYDVPSWCEPKVHRDHHIEVLKALYSVPGELIGRYLKARADAQLVRVFDRGKLVKVHPRKPPGGRSTDPSDLPAHKTAYALRDINRLKALASSHGPNVGAFAARLLDSELPWTKMRTVYRLLSLVRRFGAQRVDEACAKSLELDVVDVSLIARMLERALEGRPTQRRPDAKVIPLRFARPAEEFRPPRNDGGAR